ncbi:MAG: fibronectin type III domain-containing protein [Acidobacteria bacterium]|nr:fibronectin type III domain-containing protein [Acidobacteriota bacterium]
MRRQSRSLFPLFVCFAVSSCTAALALVPRGDSSRFDPLAIAPPGQVIPTVAEPADDLPSTDALRTGWNDFSARHGGWAAWLDHRTGLPTLAQGAGIPWISGTANVLPLAEGDPLALLEGRARTLLAQNEHLLGSWPAQLQLDREASKKVNDHVWQIVFRQVVDGVPVEGARLEFQVAHGNLVAFGAERLARVRGPQVPRIGVAEAEAALHEYLSVRSASELEQDALPLLTLVPVDPQGVPAGRWAGVRGEGLTHQLVWRFRFHVPGEEARWVADVDARTAQVVALFDDTRYDRVKGGVFPLSSDGIGPEGVEVPGLPVPFADISIDGAPAITASAHGQYACSTPGAAARTTLNGPYVRINDACGLVSETVFCGETLDLRQGPGTNCDVPAGSSPGNTHASRTCFYHVNRLKEKLRYWLPGNAWLQGQVTVNSNVNNTCNASWGGSLNMYRAGNGCRNTCELSGVFSHELGHGLDQNDGGGFDNPSEGYADVVAILEARESCVGRGFSDSNCSGYGDACLDCTGVRDEDWAKHASNTPATPQGFLTNNCGGGGGPCGKEEHCEARVSAEAMFDLATRDLPAAGLDADSAWQLAERLFYQSRNGSGGSAYNCALPSSDGCGTGSWFHKLRVADDDDGNLNNGTPHAAAIFAAFKRHNIACGTAADAANKNTSACPSLSQPALSTAVEGSGIRLTWNSIANAAKYRVFRGELGCDRSQVPVAEVTAPATTWLDPDVASIIDIAYRVQAVGSNAACESRVSNCETASYISLAGRIEFVRLSYGCGETVVVQVVDGNAGPGPLAVQVWSDSETAPETLSLVETAPGSHVYSANLATTTGPAVPDDGALAVAGNAQLTAKYVDENDGTGTAVASFGSSIMDCGASAPGMPQVTDLTDSSAIVRWTTPEPTTGRVEWGATPALGSVAQDSALTTDHAVTLSPLNECGRYYFRIFAIDRAGNEAALDVGGQPFAFNGGRIPGFFRDDFETNSGWGLAGEWQLNTPQGKGTNNPDPAAAFGGAKVLGHDLTGLGARPGDYEQNIVQRATSPVLNAAGKTGVEMKFQRWLNVNRGTTAAVEVRVNNGAWQRVWTSNINFGQRASSWSQQTLNLSQWADNQANFQVSFLLDSGSDSGASSWNVDRLVVRQSSQPLGEVCGGCAGAPGFGGALAASDSDPCSTVGGAVITWDPAASWGTGVSGTYSVYRSTTPGFTPDASNRIATGLATTSYTDTSAAQGQTYHYLVRAENNESCGSGPNNGGLTDSNTVYRSVTMASSQPLPPAVNGLGIQPPIEDDLRLTWAPTSASLYDVYRSASPASGFSSVVQSPLPSAFDDGAAADGDSWYYLVRGSNLCGQEGP